MSLLSRLRGSKGYGACRDAVSPRADQPKGDGARVSLSYGRKTFFDRMKNARCILQRAFGCKNQSVT